MCCRRTAPSSRRLSSLLAPPLAGRSHLDAVDAFRILPQGICFAFPAPEFPVNVLLRCEVAQDLPERCLLQVSFDISEMRIATASLVWGHPSVDRTVQERVSWQLFCWSRYRTREHIVLC